MSAMGVGALVPILLAGCEAPPAASSSTAAATATTSSAQESGTVVPTAAERAAFAQATSVAGVAAARLVAGAETLRVYRSRAGLALQGYANALGALREKDREIAERPILIGDPVWVFRAKGAMQSMQVATDQLTALNTPLNPAPPEMTVTAALIDQVAGETIVLTRDYRLGMDRADLSAIATAGARSKAILDLLSRANLELRRGAA